jgi:Na+/melibiose symporter-like transporter
VAFGCRRFIWLAGSYLLMLTGAGALSAAAPYLIVRVLGRPERDLGSVLGIMLLFTTFTIPLCSALGRRFGDRRVLACGAIAYALLTVVLGLASGAEQSWLLTLVLFAGLGAPFAAAQVLPFTLLAHLVHEEVATGGGAEGVFTGMWTAAEKIGLALGPSIVGLALTLGGDARGIIPPVIAIAPAALMLVALVPLFLGRPGAATAGQRGQRAAQ